MFFLSQVWHKTKYWYLIRNNVFMLENKWCEIVNCFIEFKFCRVDYFFFLMFFLYVFAVLRIKRKRFWLILILFCKMKKKMMWLMVQCIYDYSNIVKFYCNNLIWINLHVHVYEHNQCRDFLHNIPVFTKVYCLLRLNDCHALLFYFIGICFLGEIKVHTWVNRIIS